MAYNKKDKSAAPKFPFSGTAAPKNLATALERLLYPEIPGNLGISEKKFCICPYDILKLHNSNASVFLIHHRAHKRIRKIK